MKHCKNKYYRRSRVSEYVFRRLIRAFAMDLTATDAAELTGLSVRSVNPIYLPSAPNHQRQTRAWCGRQDHRLWHLQTPGSRLHQDRAGREEKTLQKAIRGRVSLQSIVHSDGWPGYDGLVDVGYAKHLRVNHGEDEFARGRAHINGIESFWSYAKHRLAKFHGVPRHTFYLHLKETEFRFNHRRDNLYQSTLKLFRKKPI